MSDATTTTAAATGPGDAADTDSGRIPGLARHWPGFLRGRAFGDNIPLAASRP